MLYFASKLKPRDWFLIALGFLLCYLLSCQTYPVADPQKQAEQVYKKELKFDVDGTSFKGIAVLPRKPAYKITLYPEGNIDRLIVQSCNREIIADKPATSGWINKSYSFKYDPLPGIEDDRSCPLEIAALEEKQIKNGFAFIDFRDKREEISLPAYMKCNGEYSVIEGTGICQAASGLRQGIFFQSQTILDGVEGQCNTMETKDGFFYEWNIAPTKCVYYFVARQKHANGHRMVFRLNALGYTVVPFKKE